MGARVGLHSRRATRSSEPIVSSIKKPWDFDVVCPSCGALAEVKKGAGVGFICADIRCDFRHGWRLDMTSSTEPIVVNDLRENPDGTRFKSHKTRESRSMVAIPLDAEGGMLDYSLATPWPRHSSAETLELPAAKAA